MIQLLRDTLSRVEELQKDLRRLKAQHVNSQTDRKSFQLLVDDYFRQIRPSIAIYPALNDKLEEIDATFQEILTLTHGRSSITAYKKSLSRCKAFLIKLEALSLTQASSSGGKPQGSVIDSRILETLRRLVPSAAAAYEQALADLEDSKRTSYRGPATDLREALRETLDHLAPDTAVIKREGYKAEPNTTGPTMKQKVRYILVTRGISRTLTEPPERAAEAIEEAVGAFVRSVYTRSSISTHTPTDRNEVLRIRDWVRVVMCELLEIGTA